MINLGISTYAIWNQHQTKPFGLSTLKESTPKLCCTDTNTVTGTTISEKQKYDIVGYDN